MIEIRLGDRYAKSVLDLAVERGALESVHADFTRIEQVCSQNPDFVRMLKSPIIQSDKKHAVLTELFGKGSHEITKLFIHILVNKKREAFLRDIAIRFLHQYDLHQNITRGLVISATPLSDAQRNEIKKAVESGLKTAFEIEEKLDPSLIGGFTLRVGDLLFDASLASRLRKLSQEFDSNPYVKQV
jgi:F-type H+-transporting ATPase subunit delta